MGTQGQGRDVVFLSGKRTGFGTFGGSLKDFSATDLAVVSSRAAIAEAGIEPAQVDHTFFGNALQTSSDAIYLARHVALRSGVPQEKGALTVNRLCGSGFEAIVQGAKDILLGEAVCALAGGAESMSQAPHVLPGARWGRLRGRALAGAPRPELWAHHGPDRREARRAVRGDPRGGGPRGPEQPAAGETGVGRGALRRGSGPGGAQDAQR